MSSPPFMKWWIAAYAANTKHLNRAQHGSYKLLLEAMWVAGGSLPADDAQLAQIALCSAYEWEQDRRIILDFFIVRSGRLTHQRLLEELHAATALVDRRKRAGKAGGYARAAKANERLSKGNPGAIASDPGKRLASRDKKEEDTYPDREVEASTELTRKQPSPIKNVQHYTPEDFE